MTPRPYPHRVRARRAGEVVFDTTDAQVDDPAPDKAPTLYVGGVAIDPDEHDVEVLDDGGDAKAFPPWGDVDDLVDTLDVRPTGDGRFEGVVRGYWTRPVIEGSQILGQAIVAAGRHTPGRRVVSAWMAFTRGGDALKPLDLELQEVNGGRTFSSLNVFARQGPRVCANGSMLLDVTAPEVIRHGVEAPAVPGPDDCPPFDMGVTGRDLRVVDGAYTGDPGAPVGPPVLDTWVRFHRVPDDPVLHAGLLAQYMGHMPIAASLRPYPGIGQDQAHRTLSTAIMAISVAFHADARVDQWLLYHHHSTSAAGGMTHSECRVHDQAGDLVASFTVDAMVRNFADPDAPTDDRTTL